MRTWTKEEITNLLQTNDRMVCVSIKRLYMEQTAEEKMYAETHENNGYGFNAFDAEILSDFAEGFMKYGRLTERQMVVARKKIMKYARQLAELANLDEQGE